MWWLQEGAILLMQALIQHFASAHLGCFMAAQVVASASLRSAELAELICRRLADHTHFLPSWLDIIQELAASLPVEDRLATDAHPSDKFMHLLCLVQGLGNLLAGANHDGHMLHGKLLHCSLRNPQTQWLWSTANTTVSAFA